MRRMNMSQFRITNWILCRVRFNTIFLDFTTSGTKIKINDNMHQIQYLRRQKWFKGTGLMMFGPTREYVSRNNLRIPEDLNKQYRLRTNKGIN
jgi:hypothetical protein